MKKILCRFILVISLIANSYATETCSRVATINYQEVLVDSNSSDKGEGLRFHLEKDPEAKKYLDIYQANSSITWPNAIFGTLGTGLILVGFFKRNNLDKEVYLVTGTSIILINFLIAKTLESKNEENLTKAIEEYNKRNLPKIFFSPEENRSQNDFFQYKVGFLKTWSF